MTKPPTTKAEPRKATTQELADRLRAAIFKLSNHPKSDMAALLQRYMGFLAPSMAKYGTERFPRTYRPHAVNYDRSTESSKSALLIFHVADAIGAYFAAVRSKGGADQMALLEPRVALIEDIAKRNINGYQAHGSPMLGFCLMTPAQIESWEAKKNVVPNAKAPEGQQLPNP
jgi:hypothetical protein